MSSPDNHQRTVDVVIIGGGQAGLSLSYYLGQAQIEHVVLERERAFSAWYKRWDSFKMNTANWMNQLPGSDRKFAPGSRWYSVADRHAALVYFEDYLQGQSFPLQENCEVLRAEQSDNGDWICTTAQQTYRSRTLAICSGHAARPKIPEFAKQLPAEVQQLHTSDYRRPKQVTKRNVLVVGSGSSGVQICEDLAQSKRFESVSLAASGNRVLPWKIWGIPIGVYARVMRVFDIPRGSRRWNKLGLEPEKGDTAMAPAPSELARAYDVRVIGRVAAVRDYSIICEDETQVPLDDLAVVWCTGFRADYNFLRIGNREKVMDDQGPIENRGVAENVSGLYFLGLKFQNTSGSHLIYGIGRDAQYVAAHVVQYLGKTASS